MDPNANLAEQAQLLDSIVNVDKRRLSELRHALQAWLAHSGITPKWADQPAATIAYRTWTRNMRKFQDLYR